MTQLIRRSPEEMEIYFLSHISKLTYEAKAFKDHAVEVLAEKCHYNSELWDENRDMPEWEEIDESRKDRYRAEAKQLLGVDNNNKEKKDE